MQREILNWLQDILPEIRRTGNPEDTMLKFAREHDLQPALLERLAQVFNTAKTVRWLDKSAGADRGASFHIVDGPALVERYTRVEKAAAVRPVAVVTPFPRTRMEKAASAEAKPVTVHPRQMRKEAEAQALEIDLLRQIEFNSVEDARAESIKLARACRSADWASIEADALAIDPQLKEACDFVARALDTERVTYKRASAPTKGLVLDRYNLVEAVHSIGNHLAARKVAAELAEQLEKSAGKSRDRRAAKRTDGEAAVEEAEAPKVPTEQTIREIPVAEDIRGPGVPEIEPPAEEEVPSYGGGPDEPYTDPGQPPPATGMPPGGYQSAQQPPPYHGTRPTAKAPFAWPAGGAPKAPASVGKVSPGKSLLSPLSSALNATNSLKAPGHFLDLAKGALPTRNKVQEKIDTDFKNDVVRTNVERLIATDAVLSEADPQVVVSLANSIRQNSPDVAHDINALRYALREAVQYQSLPTTAVRDLAGIQGTVNKNRADEAQSNERLYSQGIKPKVTKS